MMYRLLVYLMGRQAPIRFYFDKKDAAQAAIGESFEPSDGRNIQDDYGNSCCFRASMIEAILLTDIARDMKGDGKVAIMQAQLQAETNQQAQADPRLRAAGMARPGILHG